eukprot:CAMPEP_0198363648 /NCGR_PEP_ID=MMETSP1450-20131203/150563_1 /TAXON_ID=753684 ORGANISM="Madagascaria erythrocladiodes, Strain CCMP3234" /NCGR_SAMPLE_ID=MMETSP1450 /ASSEMBLY_ACC=CAM_ASM_001115 /LENGTH=60 /DNA_ID=CAMNT_0044070999 /DNA_START=45 /DNA_END=223 /DNA_ORIENTATION=+
MNDFGSATAAGGRAWLARRSGKSTEHSTPRVDVDGDDAHLYNGSFAAGAGGGQRRTSLSA